MILGIGIAGPVIFTVGWLRAGTVTPGDSHLAEPISQLAAIGAPFALIQQVGFFVIGVSMVVVGSERSAVLTGIFQDDPTGTVRQSTSGLLHRITGAAFVLGAIAAAFASAIRVRQVPEMRDAVFSILPVSCTRSPRGHRGRLA